jgi:hypothetical protein
MIRQGNVDQKPLRGIWLDDRSAKQPPLLCRRGRVLKEED